MEKIAPSTLSNHALIAATRAVVVRTNGLTADLIAYLAEIDRRKLYLEQAHPSLFAWCTAELGCSGDVAYNWIAVARASRTWPAVLDALREGRIHLTGLRMLVPHLTHDGHRELLQAASGKTKREIEELVARVAPKPPVPSSIRKLPTPKDGQMALQPTEGGRKSPAQSEAAALPKVPPPEEGPTQGTTQASLLWRPPTGADPQGATASQGSGLPNDVSSKGNGPFPPCPSMPKCTIGRMTDVFRLTITRLNVNCAQP